LRSLMAKTIACATASICPRCMLRESCSNGHQIISKGCLDVDQIMDCDGCVSSYYQHHILPDERVPTAHLQAPSRQRAALSRSLQPTMYADHAPLRLRHRVHESKRRAGPQGICLSSALERSRDTGLDMKEISGRSRMDQYQKDNHCAMGRPRRRCSGSLAGHASLHAQTIFSALSTAIGSFLLVREY
jgi:hypothetical protein